jgi:hypothetical protein
MRIQSSHCFGARGLDAYWTCFETIQSLILLEGDRMPRRVWEPAVGAGAIVCPLQARGRFVVSSDIFDYGLPGCDISDYLTTPMLRQVDGIVTNPPYRKAQAFEGHYQPTSNAGTAPGPLKAASRLLSGPADAPLYPVSDRAGLHCHVA